VALFGASFDKTPVCRALYPVSRALVVGAERRSPPPRRVLTAFVDQRGAGRHDVCGETLDAFVKRTLLRREFENRD
jgi:hypothetical protein